MNLLAPMATSKSLPALVANAGERAGVRFVEFFAANIRNPHTRRAYARAVEDFLAWCEDVGVRSLNCKIACNNDPLRGENRVQFRPL